MLMYGNCTCSYEQVISVDNYIKSEGNTWSCQQQNSNNGWNFNLNNGNTNNNNKNNTNFLVPCAEYLNNLIDSFFDAERECYKNKRQKLDANQCHFHLAQIWSLIYRVITDTYVPDISICFVLDYPTWREVFAAKYWDRVVHHLIAPYLSNLAEQVHIKNGNVSHGNRKNHSAHTAALQVQKLMRENPNGIVFKIDIQGFFMSIDRSMAYDMFLDLDSKYKPDISDDLHALICKLVKILFLSDPTKNCERHSAIELWKFIKPEKSLFGNNGKGMPIGNFYSQIDAGIVLSYVDRVIHIPHFVDDFADVCDNIQQVKQTIQLAKETMAKYGLKMHPKKIYIQPVRHGVKLCGRVIYKNRMYASNRILHSAFTRLEDILKRGTNPINAVYVLQTFNSYAGIMCHMSEYNTQKAMMQKVFEYGFGEYLYFRVAENHIICQLKKEYGCIVKSSKQIKDLDNNLKFRTMAAIVQGSRAGLPKVENKSGRWYFHACYEQVEQTTDEVRCVEVVLMSCNKYAAAQQVNAFNEERGSVERITPDYFDNPYTLNN